MSAKYVNYRGIHLISCVIKFWERLIDSKLRLEICISKDRFGFMPPRSTMKVIDDRAMSSVGTLVTGYIT